MALLKKLRIIPYLILLIITTAITFYTIVEFMIFLSDPHYKIRAWGREVSWTKTSWSLLVNQMLLSAFVVQHSIMALPTVKSWMSNFKAFRRCIYVALTSACLQIIVRYWHPIPEVVLWNVNTNLRIYWWSFLLLHVLAWAVIYVGAICLDINELLGIKHVYYEMRQLPDPNEYKSPDLKKLYSHMRHPSFIGFVCILWIVPSMSLDRLVLATILSAYMYFAWNTDERDYKYQELQGRRKFHELNYLK